MTTDTLITLASIIASFATLMLSTWFLFKTKQAEREEYAAFMDLYEKVFREANNMPRPPSPPRYSSIDRAIDHTITFAFERTDVFYTASVVAAAVGGASQFAAGNYWTMAGAGVWAVVVLLISDARS